MVVPITGSASKTWCMTHSRGNINIEPSAVDIEISFACGDFYFKRVLCWTVSSWYTMSWIIMFYLRISIVVYVLFGLRMYPKLGSPRKMPLCHQDHSWLFVKTLESVEQTLWKCTKKKSFNQQFILIWSMV